MSAEPAPVECPTGTVVVHVSVSGTQLAGGVTPQITVPGEPPPPVVPLPVVYSVRASGTIVNSTTALVAVVAQRLSVKQPMANR
jgi:hypothetical protein